MRISTTHIGCMMLVLLCALSVAPIVRADRDVVVDFSLTSDGQTVDVTVIAQGELPSEVVFAISLWYNAPGTHGFVALYSGQVMVDSASGVALADVQAAIPAGLDQVHYFVVVDVYDASNGNLIASAGHDPRTGGSNGPAG